MTLRHFMLVGISALLAGSGSVSGGQNRSSDTAAFVAQQNAEERHRRLATTVEDLQTANVTLQRRIQMLEQQLQKAVKNLSDQQAEGVTTEQLEALSKKFTEELQKLEDRRVADNKKILEEIRKLANRPAPAPTPPVVQKAEPELEAYTGPVYEVEVQSGYTISAIAKKYRDAGHDITTEDILRANPGLDPRRIRPGDIINVPAKQ